MDELRKQVRELIEQVTDKIVNLTVKEGNRMVGIRLREARDRARKTRYGRPYGIEPCDPKEIEGLEIILRLRKNGLSMRGIAEALERHGLPTPRTGVYWNPGTVKRILNRNGVI